MKEEEQSSETDPDESSYQSSPQAVLETTGSSISTDSDASGIEWQSLNHTGILSFSCCWYFQFLIFFTSSYPIYFEKKKYTNSAYYRLFPSIITTFLYIRTVNRE